MSSASYHMFAIFMDVGVIPFYVFIGIFANNNLLMDPKEEQRWTSYFTGDGQTGTLLSFTFIGALVVAGLHAVSTVLDLWLVILFRKIAKLPPDLNPLEDNLTSRQSSKHKYKNSEATLTESVDEKNQKYLSGSTLNGDDQSRLATAAKGVPDTRQVPFRHSRTGSELGYSPHNPDSARWSRQNMEDNLYQQPQSARGSMASVRPHTRGNSMSPSKAAFIMTETPPTPTHSSRPVSYPNNQSAGGTFSSNRFSAPALPNAAPSHALVRSQQQNSLLSSNNWVALDDDENDGADLGSPDRYRQNYEDENTIERHDSFQPQPLKMNPPTPPPPATKDRYHAPDNRNALSVRTDNGNGNADLNRHLTVKSDATMSSSVYSESSPELKTSKISPGTPKSKYYGDLAAATRGVRGGAHAYKSSERFRSTGTVDASSFDATGMSAMSGYGYSYAADPPSPSKAGKKSKPTYHQQNNSPAKSVHASTTYKSNDTLRSTSTGTLDAAEYDATGESALGAYGFCPSPPPKVPRINRDAKGRVISRSGVDLADASQHMVDAARAQAQGLGGAGGRRRDVSGKVAEEGRGRVAEDGGWGRWRRY